jgi:hypothetical protein
MEVIASIAVPVTVGGAMVTARLAHWLFAHHGHWR